MTLWWLQADWKKAICFCGVNIWDSGGDPDSGLCLSCFTQRQEDKRRRTISMCDHAAQQREPKESSEFGEIEGD